LLALCKSMWENKWPIKSSYFKTLAFNYSSVGSMVCEPNLT
jgi:hypothetical protein